LLGLILGAFLAVLILAARKEIKTGWLFIAFFLFSEAKKKILPFFLLILLKILITGTYYVAARKGTK
jgi:hypothetical protein